MIWLLPTYVLEGSWDTELSSEQITKDGLALPLLMRARFTKFFRYSNEVTAVYESILLHWVLVGW